MQRSCLFFHKRFKTVQRLFISHKRLKSSRFFIFHNRSENAAMEEQLPNGANNYDLHRDRDNRVIEIFQRMNRLIKEEIHKGRVWQKLASQKIGEIIYLLHRLPRREPAKGFSVHNKVFVAKINNILKVIVAKINNIWKQLFI